ncbi:MAG TPA: NAD(P)-dependent alcohol dehydrogenase [Actinomycetes bacterium]|jgi:NADPH:quinone reductase-like Zn-dependent oxidoreductase|nr:NAD(P)-dependent alcohol dehydrogenase [Actinomycetes bacterium]
MKAAVRTRYGPPEVVRIAEVDKPAPGDGELLVRVHATTVNRTDCGWLAVKPFVVRFFTGLTRPRLTVLGNEYAGRVEAVGAGVTSFEVGDRVFGFTGLRFGAHAEYLAVPQDDALATMPASLTYEQAAPSSEGAHYALTMIRKAKVRGGQAVLVNGATGAIGSAAVQLLASLGARVTAVCGTEHVELVKGLGAERVIDYQAEDFTRDAQTYDAVLDAVGKSSFVRCRRLLKPRGLYLSSDAGPLSQNLLWLLVTPLFGGRRVLFSVPRRNQETMGYLKGLIETGAFRPLIDRRYPLDRIVEAYRYVESGQKVGNVVVGVAAPT